MAKILTGQCMCGNVTYQLEDNFSAFFQCHCKQCQQMSGSAFASNMFTPAENITWLTGEANIRHYSHESRKFAQSFCQNCGSPVPYPSSNGKLFIVPAGSLNEAAHVTVNANIFHGERCWWANDNFESAPTFEGFPK